MPDSTVDSALELGLKNLGWRSQASRIVIYLTMAFAAAQIALAMTAFASGQPLTENSPVLLARSFRALMFIVSAVFVGMWIYRANANLKAANVPGLRFSPGWAVGHFFVPVTSLFKPFQAMRDLWNASIHESAQSAPPTPMELKLWWGAFLTSIMIDNILGRIQLEQTSTVRLQTLMVVVIISGGAIMISAWYLLKIIRRVTQAQQNQLRLGKVFG